MMSLCTRQLRSLLRTSHARPRVCRQRALVVEAEHAIPRLSKGLQHRLGQFHHAKRAETSPESPSHSSKRGISSGGVDGQLLKVGAHRHLSHLGAEADGFLGRKSRDLAWFKNHVWPFCRSSRCFLLASMSFLSFSAGLQIFRHI